jgi:hypothetical protein
MGRAQLSNGRLNDTVAKLERQYPVRRDVPGGPQIVDFRRCRRYQESDRCYGMFHDVTAKFYTLASCNRARQLSQLFAAELRFAIITSILNTRSKRIRLEDALPTFRGLRVIILVSGLVAAGDAPDAASDGKNLYVETRHDDSCTSSEYDTAHLRSRRKKNGSWNHPRGDESSAAAVIDPPAII